jgi:uncharacterized membrane protein HdeD (DUF308 family)
MRTDAGDDVVRGGAMTTMNMMFEDREAIEEAADRWWLFLLTGMTWLVFALLVFQWSHTTVYAISFLFGVVALFAAVNEFVVTTGFLSAPPALRALLSTFGALSAGAVH